MFLFSALRYLLVVDELLVLFVFLRSRVDRVNRLTLVDPVCVHVYRLR